MLVHLRRMAILSVMALILLVLYAILATYSNYFPARFDRGFLALHRDHFAGIYATAFYLHIVATPLALFFGLGQFNRALQRRSPTLHRTFGKIYVTSILGFASPSGFVMAWYAYGGWISIAGFSTLAILTWLFTWKAWREILQRRIQSHANWMMRSYALMTGALVLRIMAMLARDFELDGLVAYRTAAWTSWILPWMLVEISLRQSSTSSAQTYAKRAHDG